MKTHPTSMSPSVNRTCFVNVSIFSFSFSFSYAKFEHPVFFYGNSYSIEEKQIGTIEHKAVGGLHTKDFSHTNNIQWP